MGFYDYRKQQTQPAAPSAPLGQQPLGATDRMPRMVDQLPSLPGGATGGSPGGAPQPYQGRMPGNMDFLNNLLQQSSSPVSASDPTIAPAFAAGRVADQRNIDRQRASLAEQLGGSHLGDSGAMQTKTSGIQQRVGEQRVGDALRRRQRAAERAVAGVGPR
jgi:hypothetical protein